jgi:hypothetical protein
MHLCRVYNKAAMTATNHMLFGAVLAVGVQKPLLIAPLAVISHFVLDILPHFGVHRHNSTKRNKHPLFQYVVIIDILLTAALLVLLPSILGGAVSWWVLLIGMVFAFLPDAIWIYRFFYEARHKKKHRSERLAWFHRFHAKIQWGERSWGVFIELVWFGAMGVWLGVLAA